MLRRLSAIPLAALLVLLVAWPAAAAQTYEVTSTADAPGSCPKLREECTLRQAITNANLPANVGSTIHVPAGTYTLTSALPVIGQNVQVTGDGLTKTTISGGNLVRVFEVDGDANLGLTDLTVANGNAGLRAPTGGNLLIENGAGLAGLRVRVTGGHAANGAGIAVSNAGASFVRSIIDNNTATTIGGAAYILAESGSVANTFLLTDSTVAFNTAPTGAGIATTGVNDAVTLRFATVADNTASAAAGGGLYLAQANPGFTVQSSILARNTGNVRPAGVPAVTGPSNCSTNKPTNRGQNVETGSDCGFTNGSQNADAGLATQLATVNGTYVLLPLAASPAIDRAVTCPTNALDQTSSPRPVGKACDSGAVEYIPPVVVPTPTATPAPQPTVAPTPEPTATPTPTPVPVFHKTVVVSQAGGTILVRDPGAKTFHALPAVQAIKLGATVDARKGVVILTSIPKAGGTPETAKFYDGMFKVTQTGDVTTLTLNEPLTGCPKAKKASASAAEKKPKTRKLWGDGKGKFRTKGQYSAATIRGTKWLVTDTCTSTVTRVAEGVVTVNDFVKKKSLALRKGKTYTARARR